ncbi:MAG: substrate-binding domain-containing protein [Gemmobacter sp.]|jgi:putative spermidine/putrescine transport system substrate-binding protein|nr:substrate-binding domain-containing protein [Gemmobacter sp.]
MSRPLNLNRRHFLASTMAVGAMPMLGSPLVAQSRPQLQLQSLGGAYEKILRETAIPAFEAAHNIEVVFTVEDDVAMLPRLIAARGRPVYDVVTCDNPVAFAGAELWAEDQTANLPNAADVYASSRPPVTANYGVIVYEYAFVHDKDKLPNVESWMDLWTNDIVVGVPHISQAYGLTFLYIAAMLHGGSAEDLTPGIEAIKKLKNFKIYKNVSEGLNLFQQKEVDAALFYSHRAQQMIDMGLNLGRAKPKEGTWGQRTGAQIPKSAANMEAALLWVNYMMGPEYQTAFLPGLYSPTNSKVVAPPELAPKLLLGQDVVDAIREMDWAVILPQRDKLVDLWTREIG